MKKTIAGTVAALAIAAAVPLSANARGDGDDQGMRGGHHGEHPRHGMRGHHGKDTAGRSGMVRMVEMIEIYDADGDGSVSQAEIDEWRANRLRAFDANGDGQLSLDEYQALWLDAMRERMVDQFQSHDDDGDGEVTIEEFAARTGHLILMHDRNDDRVLNLDDMRHGHHGDRPHHAMPGQPSPPAGQNPPADPAAPAHQ